MAKSVPLASAGWNDISDRPLLAGILRAVEIPPVGGDTVWANTVTAYQDLPAPLRSMADQLWAVHRNSYTDYEKIDDFGSHPRRVQRVTLVGDLPMSIDGRTSEAIRGDASAYNRLS